MSIIVQIKWCGVVAWVKKKYLEVVFEIKKSEGFVKKVYVSEIEGPKNRGRPVVRWKDSVME